MTKTSLHALVAEHSPLPMELHGMIVRVCEPALFGSIAQSTIIDGVIGIWFAHRLPSESEDESWACQSPFDRHWYQFGRSSNGNGSAPLVVTEVAPGWVLID